MSETTTWPSRNVTEAISGEQTTAAGLEPGQYRANYTGALERVGVMDPCPDTVALAAKRAVRWARDNTTWSAAEIIGLDLAIRDLAGPT